jgi:multiple sugar transport system substrate-binding protein
VVRQFTALGGQAASIVTYSKKQDLALKWLEWFIRPEVQMKWAELGGYTCHTATLESDIFLNATPYNAAFKKSMEVFKDFWSVPEYSELLNIFSETLGKYIIRGESSAQEVLQRCTELWEEVFDDAGYYD